MSTIHRFSTSLTVLVSFIFSIAATASTVSRVDVEPRRADVNKPVAVNLSFATEDVSCGLKVDWGNGKVDKVRVGKDHQLRPPYTLENVYSSTGSFKVVVTGEMLLRGLRSVGPCDVSVAHVVQVIDPLVEAKLAEERASRERLELAAKEAERIEKARQAEEEARKQEIAIAQQRERNEAEQRERASRTFTVLNSSSERVERLFMSLSGDNSWGSDRLGKNVLNKGQQTTFTLNSCGKWDVRVEFGDSTVTEVKNTELCAGRLNLTDANRIAEVRSQPSQSRQQAARTYCVVGGAGAPWCGLSWEQCSKVVAGLPLLSCR